MKTILLSLFFVCLTLFVNAQDTTQTNYLKARGGISSTNINNYTLNGIYGVGYAGQHSSTILCLMGGGSTGPFQMEAMFWGELRFRNKTDNINWTTWKSIYHSGNMDTTTYLRARVNEWSKDAAGNVRTYFQSTAVAGQGTTFLQGFGNSPLEFRNGTSTMMMRFNNAGDAGIGVAPQSGYKLTVLGTIGARKVKVTQSAWADFVFDPGYHLPSLGEIEQFIKQHQHLPEIPTAAEVEKDGVDLGEMNVKLLQKVEELTLYMIEKDKQVSELKKKMDTLAKEVELLKAGK